MARVVDDDFDERIVDVSISDEIESSFLEYAYSVIYARALPDARDGLKPVQRRILFSMDSMGIRPDKGHVKSARVVGQVMGELHPHGDSAIYDALVRMAQPWSQRLPLIDGHGNFGSLDAGPAAMRYTECRLAKSAQLLTTSLGEDTVDFKPNYDGKSQEPVVLPAAFPNLLVNGATGIAVGMATNIAPHNLVECVSALKYLIANPKATSEDLMSYIPGPDLPSGGKIIGLDGIREAYLTGRGSFKIRATARVEQVTPRRKGIVVTELPLSVGPEKIMEQIKTGVQKKKLVGIADVKDLTDLKHGTRLVVEVKNGINPDALLEELYRQTKMEDSFSINAVALVDGQPQQLTLLAMLQVFLRHRFSVVRRRTRFRLKKAEDRLHLAEGLLIAIIDIDDVIAIIRGSEDVAGARTRLREVFELSELQANYILDMQLRRLTKFSRIELESERDSLTSTIAELNQILNSDAILSELVVTELDEVAREHGTPRRTVLLSSSATPVLAAGPLEIADEPCKVLLSASGLVARLDSIDPFPIAGPRANHDVIRSVTTTSTRSDFGLITSLGRILRLQAIDLPAIPATAVAPNLAGGTPIAELTPLKSGEEVLALTSLTEETYGWVLGTERGVVKRVKPELLSNKDDWDIIRLDDGDRVIGAMELTDESGELVFVTTDAQLLHFPVSNVRPQGRSGGGMAGIKLGRNANVLFFGVVSKPGSVVVSVAGSSVSLPGTESGLIKISPFEVYPAKGRATGGVRCQRFLKGIDQLLLAWVGESPAVAGSDSGAPIELPDVDPRRDGSGVVAPRPISAVSTRSW